MKKMIKVLEQIGQTQSLNQEDSMNEIKSLLNSENLAFESVLKQSFDQVCMQFPDDDDE